MKINLQITFFKIIFFNKTKLFKIGIFENKNLKFCKLFQKYLHPFDSRKHTHVT